MKRNPWTHTEDKLIVADYLAMLEQVAAGQKINKSKTRAALLPLLNNRSEGSIEFKRCNISAVLAEQGVAWLAGYRPCYNYQASLKSAVAEVQAERAAMKGAA